MDCIIIGIAGGTGSGKSTFTNRLRDRFGDNITVIYHDNYYKRHDDIPFEERKKLNYDHPDALETDGHNSASYAPQTEYHHAAYSNCHDK